jgi:phytoene/squalene synthetase
MHDQVSESCSKLTTKSYSTSFSLGILFLNKKLRGPVYSIYGFVRFADEIVDTFHGYDKERLLQDFKRDTYRALEDRISLNPILHAFQKVVHQYNIRREWIDTFMASMEMDLDKKTYSPDKYEQYILGSAEVVGLMCLHVFTGGNDELFDRLKPYAMRLGAAFQKVNFLRDVKADKEELGRTYFPEVDLGRFTKEDKKKIEQDIEDDFREALKGIKQLPKTSRCGVYLAYYYYTRLFRKIKRLPPQRILEERIRIANFEKLILMLKSRVRYQLNLIR